VTAAGQVLTLRNLELKGGATDQGTVAGNCTSGSGQGAAVCALGAVLLNNSTITQSYALNAGGGGMYVENGDLVAIRSVVTVNSIFNANAAEGGGGIYVKNGAVALLESLVAGNRTYGPFAAGGGILGWRRADHVQQHVVRQRHAGRLCTGGGAHVANGDIDILASTVSGNSTAFAATLSFGGGLSVVDGDMTINASTVTNNSAAAGGPYLNNGAAHRLDLYSTILAGNGIDNVLSVSGTVNASYSLFGDGAGEINGTNASNVFSNAPDLIGLNNNGCANPAGKPGIATAQCPRTHLPTARVRPSMPAHNPWGYATDQREHRVCADLRQPDGHRRHRERPRPARVFPARFHRRGVRPDGDDHGRAQAGFGGSGECRLRNQQRHGDRRQRLYDQLRDAQLGSRRRREQELHGAGHRRRDMGDFGDSEPDAEQPWRQRRAGPAGSAILTINDNDSGPGLLQFSAAAYSVGESGGLKTIAVQRVGGSNGVVMVDYATSNGTALAGSDYTTTSGTLMWGNGDSANKTFNVPIANDGAVKRRPQPHAVNHSSGALVGSRARRC
jgi:hypothetical protein